MMVSWSRVLIFLLLTLIIALIIHPSKLRLGLAMLHSGNELKANEYLEILLQNGDSSRRNLVSLAQIAEAHSDYKKSIEYWQLLILTYPKIQAYYDSLMIRYLWLGERQKSLDLILRKQEYFPLSAHDSKYMITLSEQLGQFELSAQQFWQEYQKHPQNVNVDVLRSLCFEANLLICREALLEKKLSTNPLDRGSFEELGALYAYEKNDSALQNLFKKQQVARGSGAQIRLLNDAFYWQYNDYIQVNKHHWQDANNNLILLKWIQTLEGIGEAIEAEKALEFYVLRQPSHKNKRILLQFYAKHNRPQKHSQLLNQLYLQGLTSPQENREIWATDLWTHQEEQNFPTWLWQNRHRIPQPKSKQLLNILSSTMTINQQHQWLLQAVIHDSQYQSAYEKWIYSVGATTQFNQASQQIWSRLNPSTQSRLAKYFFLWAKGDRRIREADFWASHIPWNDQDKLNWIIEKRDIAWSQGNYQIALTNQYTYLKETGQTPTSSLEFCKDLWWSGHKQDALQLFEKSRFTDPDLETWFADDQNLKQSSFFRQKIIGKLTQTKAYDSLMSKLIQWQMWTEAKKINAKSIQISTWWQQISFAMEQADWEFVERELHRYPQRRSQIPSSIQEKLIYKAETELWLGKTGESNFWFQMARGQGW